MDVSHQRPPRLHMIPLLLFLLVCHVGSLHVTHISDCGTARGCWKLPNGCKDASDCQTMLTWKHERRHLIIEIESKLVKPDMWLGIGFSKDDLMGNDTVFECQFPASGSGSVFLSHNTAKQNIVLKTASELLIRDGFTEFVDGKAMCGGEWILDNIHLDTQERNLMHVISSGRYNLFFAYGPMANGEKKMHGMSGKEAPWRSQEQVRFCQRCSSSFANLDSQKTDDFKKQ